MSSGETSRGLDFEGLSKELLNRSRDLLPRWLPSGKFIGQEYAIGSIAGEPGQSLKISIEKGVWRDFASDDAGSDLTSLYAAIRGISQGEAAKDLAEQIGFPLGHTPGKRKPRAAKPPTTNGNGHHAAPAQPEITLPPEGAPEPTMKHPIHGHPSKSWKYTGFDGETLFYVARYNAGQDKNFLPWSWSQGKWVAKGWPAPRPLYGLELLRQHPSRPVMIVEGEKSADAARVMAGHKYVVITWPNGSKAYDKTDWSPVYGRSVLIWPDSDEPGILAAQGIAALLHPHCSEVKVLDLSLPDMYVTQDGFDAADALQLEWKWADLLDWAKPRVRKFEPPVVVTPAATEVLPAEPTTTPLDPPTEAEKAVVQADQAAREGLFQDLLLTADDKQSQLAQLLVDSADGRLMYDDQRGRFYAFNKVWRPMMEPDVQRLIQRGFNQAFAYGYAANKLNSTYRLFKLAVGRGRDAPIEWDERKYIPVQNGLLNLETRELEPFNKDRRIDWVLPYDYNPDAQCPTFDLLLNRLSEGDPSAHRLLLVYLAAIVRCRHDLQRYIELIGAAGSGKSSYMRVAQMLVGIENCISSNMRELGKSRFETARLYGKRLVLFTDEKDHVSEGTDVFKAITGGDLIRYEQKNNPEISSFMFDGLVIVSCNSPMTFDDHSGAIPRRRMSINIKYSVPKKDRDPKFLEKLFAEMPGVLNRLISISNQEIEDVLLDRDGSRSGSDTLMLVETNYVASWFDQRVVLEPLVTAFAGSIKREGTAIVNTEESLYANFAEWMECNGGRGVLSSRKFIAGLREMVRQRELPVDELPHSNRGIPWTGLRLRRVTDYDKPTPITGQTILMVPDPKAVQPRDQND